MQQDKKHFDSFAEFYPCYLSEHRHPISRLLHFSGSLLILILLNLALVLHTPWLLILLPIVGYGFAWIGHFLFEKNQPATFQYPLYSLMGDWVMFKDILIARVKFKDSR